MVFTVLGAVAEMERSLTVERIRAGMRNAKAKGHISGRKPFVLDLDAIRADHRSGEVAALSCQDSQRVARIVEQTAEGRCPM